jgi:hypothetical protein
MRAFELSLFELWAADHLRRFFPSECRQLGSNRLAELIRQGIARAQSYGFKANPDVCRYLDIMLVFGATFDRDLPWAKEILEDDRIVLPGMRMDLLHEAAVEHEPGLAV